MFFQHIGALLFWVCAPFLKGPANFFSGGSTRRRAYPRKKMILRDSEELIQRSISEEPSNFENKIYFETV